ncbi:MAG TPA: imidazole glycerol phosphate synthase subunit HisH [Steroidobacteraceae bacterium]|nr:imidazole glycerol phosphate synthase subunit HisH [Steroidobacteraceae bacterium]
MSAPGPEVIVIDYGVGNLLSVRRGFEHVGATVTVTGDRERILSGPRVVLPGVGAFGNAMRMLHELQLEPVIRQLVARGTPLFGICLGMQLLLDESEEFGTTAGLGLIRGRVTPIPQRALDGAPLKIPHIGWNALQASGDASWDTTVLADTRPGAEMYFVHSYMATPEDSAHRLADCAYGGHRIPAVIGLENVSGCQFHPEKSGELGLQILRRFLLQ